MLRRTMLAGLASFTLVSACSSGGSGKVSIPSQRDLVGALVRDASFSEFLQWINAADYASRLQRSGPFTLFAPDNNAIGRVRPGLRRRLMRPESRDLLRAVLAHHVVAGRVTADQLRAGRSLRTLDGDEVRLIHVGQSLQFGTGALLRTNIAASNGVIHAIAQVQFPPNVSPIFDKPDFTGN